MVVDEKQKPLGWEGLAQVLTELSPREFWSRRRGIHAPTKQRAFDMPDPIVTSESPVKIRELVDLSGRRFGRLKRDVQAELDHGRARHFEHLYGADAVYDPPAKGGSVTFWSD